MSNLTDFEDYLERMRIPLRLACTSHSGWPVVISLWYVFLDGSLYCATKETALVVKYLSENSQCAFEIASDLPPYCGIRGQARARLEKDRGPEVLEKLINRYLGSKENRLAELLLKDQDKEIAIRIDPLTLNSWDFSARMDQVSPLMRGLEDKTCP